MLSLGAFASQAALLLVSVQLVSEVEDERKKRIKQWKVEVPVRGKMKFILIIRGLHLAFPKVICQSCI